MALVKTAFLNLMCLACSAALAQLPLNSETSALFAGSGKCEQCHHSDGTALTENGVDVSMPTHWRSTMMANAARDPLWRAKVTAESAEHPALATVIQTKCNACHAPMGYKQADFDGIDTFTLVQMQASGLAQDGVSCSVCHQVQAANLGLAESFSAGYIITDSAVLYGPYDLTRNMIGYSAKQGLHIRTAGLCATCHMVITPFVDDSGNVAGEFPEQTPYLEWTNSVYHDSLPCQGCHMPKSGGSQIIAASGRTAWSPFAYHHFAGANVLGLSGLGHNIGSLNLCAPADLFDSTMARTRNRLASAAEVSSSVNIENDTLFAEITIQNNAGHKLPGGIPLRRLWVCLRLADNQDRTLFESGVWDTAGRITGLSAPYEPHHDTITEQTQVQIYEGIMKDVKRPL